MSKVVVFFFLFVINIQIFSQTEECWVGFEDEKTELLGYKNLKGEIKIEPKFTSITSAKVFRNIIAVIEPGVGSYFLLKNGKKVANDSIYLSPDYYLDCENEGKIRFRDKTTDRVGFLDKNGRILISAVYNDAKPFHNNLALAIKDAKRLCWEGAEYSKENPCEHWAWEGNLVLINTNNEVVIDSLNLIETSYLDWYSLKINQPKLNNTYVSFKTKKGDIYSFIDFNKQFEEWFYHNFLPKNKTGLLGEYLFKDITFEKKSNWVSKNKNNKEFENYAWAKDLDSNFFLNNKKKIYKILDKINNRSFETIISNGYSPVMFSYDKYKDYFTDCGSYNTVKYPYFTVNIVLKESGKIINSLGFIKTVEGDYKLLEISN